MERKIIVFIWAFLAAISAHAINHVISNTKDSGKGSLRDAVAGSSAGDSISFSKSLLNSGNDTIFLHSEISITKGIVVSGLFTSADTLFISGNDSSRIFNIDLDKSSNRKFIADGLFLINAKTSENGGAIRMLHADSLVLTHCFFKNCEADSNGGVIYSKANTTISHSVFLLNSAKKNGGALFCDSALCSITYSSFVGNDAEHLGGGIGSDTALLIAYSTFARNSADSTGAAVYANSVHINSSTIYLNSAGAIHSSQITVGGTILALNDSSNYSGHGGSINSLGYNLLSDSLTGVDKTDGVNIDSSQLRLMALTSYHGQIISYLPDSGSLAINAGNPSDLNPAQNGEIFGCRRDIGAIEREDTLTECHFIDQIACDTFTFDGKKLFTSGIYYDSLKNTQGNDSIVVLNLEIKKSSWTNRYVNVCRYYVHNKDTLTESGVYNDSLIAANGCDSILSLHLTVWRTRVGNTQDTGWGSLRKAVSCACETDTIVFDTNLISSGSATIALLSQIEVNKGITFKGLYTNKDSVFISGSGKYRLFKIDLDTAEQMQIVFDSMVLINGRVNSANGGCMHVSNCSKLTITNSVIRKNIAYHTTWTTPKKGGAIYSLADTLIMANNQFMSNSGISYVDGGAFYAAANFASIDRCSFSQNSGDVGGTVLLKCDTAIISNSRFYRNKGEDGSSLTCDSSVVYLLNDSFYNNNARFGGGIYATNSELSLENVLLIANKTERSGNGAGLLATNCVLAMDSCTVQSNRSNKDGGGIYATNCSTIIRNSSFSKDTASKGAGIFTKGGDISVRNSEFKNNLGHNGGGMYLASDSSVIISCTVTKNVAYNGPGVFVELGDLYINKSKLNENQTTLGGGSGGALFMMYTSGELEIDSCEIASNKANNSGGGIYSGTRSLHRSVIRNSQIYDNETGWHGGGICTDADTLRLIGTTVSNNYAEEEGGGIYHRYSAVYIDGCTINKNYCEEEGGGLSLEASQCYVHNSEIKSNVAEKVGGGFFIDRMWKFELHGSSITSNSAELGGGIWSSSTRTMLVSISSFDRNAATNISGYSYRRKGGAIYSDHDNLTIEECTFSNNIADTSGGALYIENSRNYHATKINASTFTGNSSWYGGSIYFDGWNRSPSRYGYRVQITNSTILGNSAVKGGAIFSEDSICVSMKSSIGAHNGSSNMFSDLLPVYHSKGYNIFSDSLKGVLASDQLNVSKSDLKLGSLQLNGGSTKTMAPDSASVAIHEGTPGDFSPAQNSPIYGGRRDVGAAEWYCFVWGPIYTQEACSYYWFVKDSLTESGTYYDTLTSVSKCDSIITLHLSIVDSFVVRNKITTCDYFVYDTDTLTKSGTYKYASVSSKGCDSLVYIELTLSDTLYSYDSLTACDFYILRSDTFYSNTLYSDTTVSPKGCDSIHFLQINIFKSDLIRDTISNCVSYFYRGDTLTKSGLYVDSFTNKLGCDSIRTLQLYILPSYATAIDTTVCDFFVHLGDTLTMTGSYSDTLVTNLGCDSIINLNLKVKLKSFGSETTKSCDSLIWNKKVYYKSGTYIDTLVNAQGCDSIASLNLTINTTSYGHDTITACDSLTWHKQTYTQTGTYSTTLANSHGCDSIVRLHLTINKTTQGSDSITSCDSFVWHKQVYRKSGVYATILTNTLACDSMATLYLTVNESKHSTNKISACELYIHKQDTFKQSGVIYDTLIARAGCDSIIRNEISILSPSNYTDTVEACNSYTWINGQTYTAFNDTSTVVLTNHLGCDSIIHLQLMINSVSDTSVTIKGQTLEAKNTKATCQWLDCQLNYSPVTGATSRTFKPDSSGSYAVELTENGCVDTSRCMNFNTVGIYEMSFAASITVYPNPTKGDVRIVSERLLRDAVIEVTDAKGKMVYSSHQKQNTALMSLSLSNQPVGVYFVRLTCDEGVATFEIVVVGRQP